MKRNLLVVLALLISSCGLEDSHRKGGLGSLENPREYFDGFSNAGLIKFKLRNYYSFSNSESSEEFLGLIIEDDIIQYDRILRIYKEILLERLIQANAKIDICGASANLDNGGGRSGTFRTLEECDLEGKLNGFSFDYRSGNVRGIIRVHVSINTYPKLIDIYFFEYIFF